MLLIKRFFAPMLCVLLLSSCTPEAPQAASSQTASTTPDGARQPVYALIVKEQSNPYMLRMYEGFAMACAEIGAKAEFCGPASYTAEAQIDIINRLIAGGKTDAIVIAANDADALEEPLKEAMAEGIQVLSLDSAVNADSRMVHIQQASPEKIGRVLIQAAYQMIDGSGTVGLISSTETATNQKLWISWMMKELEENPVKYKDFKLLPTLYGNDLPGQSAEAARKLLVEHDDLKAIITPSVVGMLAVGKTLREEKRTDVIFTGLGLPSEIAPYIEDGSCPWMYLWNPIDIGYLAAWSTYALDTGEITGAQGDTFSSGRFGQRVVIPSADGGTEILLGDPVKFDADNIGEWKLVY